MEYRVDQEGRKVLHGFGAWMTEGVFEAQQTHFVAFNVTINEYMPGWNSQLKS